jgi:hypothetical protein
LANSICYGSAALHFWANVEVVREDDRQLWENVMTELKIVRCLSCDGYGWFEDEFSGAVNDCDWCRGVGYVYRDPHGIDHKIPEAHYGAVADQLEQLEQNRMHDLGYQGTAKHPDEQPIRRNGHHPAEDDDLAS